MSITNIKPLPIPPATADVTSPAQIADFFRRHGIEVGPDPRHDGEWAATCEWHPGPEYRSMPEVWRFVGFSSGVKAWPVAAVGTLTAGKRVSLRGSTVVIEGENDRED